MIKSCKFCWGTSAILLIAIATLAYMFLVRGSVTDSADGRTAIILSGSERDLVLEEMRGFLEGIQTITAALAEKDLKTVAESARKVGMANAGGVPLTLMAKLPLEFKTLGMATHKAFDELSQEATDMGDAQVTLTKLGELINNCTACHSGYRLATESGRGS